VSYMSSVAEETFSWVLEWESGRNATSVGVGCRRKYEIDRIDRMN
jgi:hypothetical protein